MRNLALAVVKMHLNASEVVAPLIKLLTFLVYGEAQKTCVPPHTLQAKSDAIIVERVTAAGAAAWISGDTRNVMRAAFCYYRRTLRRCRHFRQNMVAKPF